MVVGVLMLPVAAWAAPSPAPASPAPAAHGDAGVLEGRVADVDYQRGIVTVDSRTQGRVSVATMPSTSVQSTDPGYHTLTDVSKGSKVQIFISKAAGHIVAQIIRLIKH